MWRQIVAERILVPTVAWMRTSRMDGPQKVLSLHNHVGGVHLKNMGYFGSAVKGRGRRSMCWRKCTLQRLPNMLVQ